MAGLQGSLQDFEITDILQLIHMNKKEGCLEITTEDDKGYIFVQNGIVMHSYTNDREGENAIQRILMWTDGDFEFIPDKKSDKKSIEVPIQHLMLEAARKIDEWKQIEGIIPTVDAVVDIVENPETGMENIKLTSEEWKMLTFVDGESTIRELAERVNQSEFATAKIFVGLISSGLVYLKEVKKEEKPKEEKKEEKAEKGEDESGVDKKEGVLKARNKKIKVKTKDKKDKDEDEEDKKTGLGRFFSR